MKLRILSAMVLMSILFSACQLATSLPGQTGVKAANFVYIFQPPAEPVSVSVALDDSRAAEAVIPVGGGTIRTVGLDGTQFQLDIPGDALLAETKIRMIPSGVTGLPFGAEHTYAVQFEPEGLFLNNFASGAACR